MSRVHLRQHTDNTSRQVQLRQLCFGRVTGPKRSAVGYGEKMYIFGTQNLSKTAPSPLIAWRGNLVTAESSLSHLGDLSEGGATRRDGQPELPSGDKGAGSSVTCVPSAMIDCSQRVRGRTRFQISRSGVRRASTSQ